MRFPSVQGLIGLIAALAGGASGDEGVPRLLLDDTLQSQPVRLVSIGMRSLTYYDTRGQMRTDGLDRYIALLPVVEPARAPQSPSAEPAATTTVDLADGQRFAGHPTGRPDDAVLEWKNPDFGDHGIMPIPLDLVRHVTLGPSARPPAPGTPGARDLIVLVNGDTVDGFIESIGEPTRIDHDSTAVDIPMERIAEVRLGGPAVRPSGLMVWLTGGSVARVSSLATDATGRVTIQLAPLDTSTAGTESLTAEVPLDRLHAAAFDMARLVPLASITPTRQAGSPERVFTEPLRTGPAAGAVLGAPDITFPGPMSVSWTLPPGAGRLGGLAELPEDCRMWGDCTLAITISSGERGREVFRAELNGASPRAEFNVELPAQPGAGATLTMSIEAGPYGPIQDRVVLQRAVLLLPPVDRPAREPRP